MNTMLDRLITEAKTEHLEDVDFPEGKFTRVLVLASGETTPERTDAVRRMALRLHWVGYLNGLSVDFRTALSDDNAGLGLKLACEQTVRMANSLEHPNMEYSVLETLDWVAQPNTEQFSSALRQSVFTSGALLLVSNKGLSSAQVFAREWAIAEGLPILEKSYGV